VLGGFGNAGEIVFQIVGVMRYVQRRVGHAGETVGVIIRIGCIFLYKQDTSLSCFKRSP
jgi:hypothetical protein